MVNEFVHVMISWPSIPHSALNLLTDQVGGFEQFSQAFFVHSHEAPGFYDIGSEHAYPTCSSLSEFSEGLSDFEFENDESIKEHEQSDPMVSDVVRSTGKWVKLLAILKWRLFTCRSARKLGNPSDHPKELV